MTAGRRVDSRRRALLGAAAALPWAGCARVEEARYGGAWLGAAHERGHVLRDARGAGASATALPAKAGEQRRAAVLVIGAGVAGLAAARALTRAGVDDVHVFELEDAAGGNSRGHSMGGMACPLGAHYLPLPGAQAGEVAELLAELGLSHGAAGATTFDERHLCHSPQERLFIRGEWVEGLLPPLDALPTSQRVQTQRDYEGFRNAVQAAGRDQTFSIPTARANRSSEALARSAALDGSSFANWLDAQGFNAPALRWYLDYCCRDDFGAGAAVVSAWAGLHYFASRHGFQLAGDADPSERGAVLTWAEGNAWLTQRLAAPLGERLHTGQLALRIREARHEASVELWNVANACVDTWSARHVVLAVPLFVAARLLESAAPGLAPAAAALQYAPWLVANLHLRTPLFDAGGAAPAWDNVIADSPTLGYVDAMHQSTRPHAGPTVLTAYWALGGSSPQELREQRARLLGVPWSHWAGAIVRELSRAHPDIASRVQAVDLMRYGHAMAIPAPGVRHSGALQALAQMRGRVRIAHSDLAGYSVFEEAFFHGDRVGRADRPGTAARTTHPTRAAAPASVIRVRFELRRTAPLDFGRRGVARLAPQAFQLLAQRAFLGRQRRFRSERGEVGVALGAFDARAFAEQQQARAHVVRQRLDAVQPTRRVGARQRDEVLVVHLQVHAAGPVVLAVQEGEAFDLFFVHGDVADVLDCDLVHLALQAALEPDEIRARRRALPAHHVEHHRADHQPGTHRTDPSRRERRAKPHQHSGDEHENHDLQRLAPCRTIDVALVAHRFFFAGGERRRHAGQTFCRAAQQQVRAHRSAEQERQLEQDRSHGSATAGRGERPWRGTGGGEADGTSNQQSGFLITLRR